MRRAQCGAIAGGMADQSMAYMFGEYQPYEAYEHGLKATVYALYEPPQTSAIEVS